MTAGTAPPVDSRPPARLHSELTNIGQTGPEAGTHGMGSSSGNHLYYGDNLSVLRESIGSESVDLVYLDPPFNSNATYSHLFKDEAGQVSGAQIAAFDDT